MANVIKTQKIPVCFLSNRIDGEISRSLGWTLFCTAEGRETSRRQKQLSSGPAGGQSAVCQCERRRKQPEKNQENYLFLADFRGKKNSAKRSKFKESKNKKGQTFLKHINPFSDSSRSTADL